ncbi:unnamed protein product [Adineta ricciae]|uniref:Uncharacterized protein n=1 Tax=Adineta ricciae TaxID=249248 RepID=A0A814JG28_ADIRI|nr:unnamed protein product [Adineta ricciae]
MQFRFQESDRILSDGRIRVKVAPSYSMKVGLSAVKAAVKFFHKLLLPQSVQLFSTDSIDDKKMIINELKVVKYPVNCFSMSDLTANSIFHNHKRDNVDVKKILSNLKHKHLLKRADDEQIKSFQNQLNESYGFTLEKYIDYYEKGSDSKSSLSEVTGQVLVQQRSWIEELREKILNNVIEQKKSEPPSPLSIQMSQVEDIFDDVIVDINDDTNDLQTTCSNTIELTNAIQQMNVSSNECHEDISMENHDVPLDHHRNNDDDIRDCLSYVLEQVVELVNVTDVTMIDRVTDHSETASSTELSRKTTTCTVDKYVSNNIKVLCDKLLLSNTIVISRTKLNKICKINIDDIEKACKVLIDYGLLSLETNVLGNKHCYYESFLKQIPKSQSELLDFSMKLSIFGIDNINSYYATLKTIDTQNATYLTPYGQSILKQVYSNHNVKINESAIMQPVKQHCRRLFNAGNDQHDSDEENLSTLRTSEAGNVEQSSEPPSSKSKRRRELTGKWKEYREQSQSKKKKKDDQ